MDAGDASTGDPEFSADEVLTITGVVESAVDCTGAHGSSKAPQEKAKANGRNRPGGGAAAAKKTPQNTCLICRDSSGNLCGNNPFCHKCKAEHDAMKKDTTTNGWADRFEEGKSNPVIFRKMVNDFRHNCASRGRGRSRPQYNAARLEDIFEQSSVCQQGNEYAMMDWFEFESWYSQKKLGDEAIEQKWREALACPEPGQVDNGGDNPAYPERVQVLVKSFRKVYDEEATRRRATRAGPTLKKAVDDEGFAALQGEVRDAQPDPSGASDHKRPRLAEAISTTLVGKRPGQLVDSGAASGASPDKDVGIGITRLRAHERWEDTLAMRVKPILAAATAKVARHSVGSSQGVASGSFPVRALGASASVCTPTSNRWPVPLVEVQPR